MKNRVNEKVIEIEKYLNSLEEFLPQDFREYLSDEKTKAACERYFEKIIESVIDLAFLVIKKNNFRSPNSDRDALIILSENGVIAKEISEKLNNAKSMRNIIIHEYGNIDDELVFEALRSELILDVKEFLEALNG